MVLTAMEDINPIVSVRDSSSKNSDIVALTKDFAEDLIFVNVDPSGKYFFFIVRFYFPKFLLICL